MIALIDIDSLFYKATYKVDELDFIDELGIDRDNKDLLNSCLVEYSYNRCQDMIDDILTDILNDENNIAISGVELYVTKCSNSIRKQIDSYYKSNRTPNELVSMLRDMYILKNDAKFNDIYEADDLIADRASELGIKNCVIVTMDKDLYQIGGFIYDYYKKPTKYDEFNNPIEIFSRKGLSYVDKFEGYKLLAKQMIKGDSGDRVKGLPKKGEVFANKAIDPCTTIFGLKRAVLKAYKDVYEDSYIEPLLLNYRLLKLGA